MKSLFQDIEGITSNFMIQRSNDETAGMKLPPRRDLILFLPRSDYQTEESLAILDGSEEPLVKIMRLKQMVNEGKGYNSPKGENTTLAEAAPCIDFKSCPKLAFVVDYIEQMGKLGDDKVVIISTLKSR